MPNHLWPKTGRRIPPPGCGRFVLVLGIIMTIVLPMACTGSSSAPAGETISFSPTNETSPSPSPVKESPEPIPTKTPLDKEIRTAIDSGKLVLIFFYSGCAPCKYRSQVNVLDALEKEYAGRLVILRIAEAEPAAEFGVTAFPTLILFAGTPEGHYSIFWRLEGTADKATLVNVLNKALGVPIETSTPSPTGQS